MKADKSNDDDGGQTDNKNGGWQANMMMTAKMTAALTMTSDKDTVMMLDNGLKRQWNFYGKDLEIKTSVCAEKTKCCLFYFNQKICAILCHTHFVII